MTILARSSLVVAVVVALGVHGAGSAAWADAKSELLSGETGAASGVRWSSGWIDLAAPTDFAAGDRFRIKVGGTATRILVRLLPIGKSPSSSAGLVGDSREVPSSRVVEVELESARERIVQISVHGGPEAWGNPLGRENGPVTLENVHLIRAKKSQN